MSDTCVARVSEETIAWIAKSDDPKYAIRCDNCDRFMVLSGDFTFPVKCECGRQHYWNIFMDIDGEVL